VHESTLLSSVFRSMGFVTVKVILPLTRREGMSVNKFRRYSREQHAPLPLQLPGLTRLVVNYAQPDHTGTHPPYDASLKTG
jgi:hypothetical protein